MLSKLNSGRCVDHKVKPPGVDPYPEASERRSFRHAPMACSQSRGKLVDLIGDDRGLSSTRAHPRAATDEPTHRVASVTASPAALSEIARLGRTLERRADDILAYFDRSGTSNEPTEAIKGRIEHLRLRPRLLSLTNYIASGHDVDGGGPVGKARQTLPLLPGRHVQATERLRPLHRPRPALGESIVGVHVAGDRRLETNFAVRLTNTEINQVKAWMRTALSPWTPS